MKPADPLNRILYSSSIYLILLVAKELSASFTSKEE